MSSDFDTRDESRYPGLPPAATPEEVEARRIKREADARRRNAEFDGMCDAIRARNRYITWLEDNYG